MKKSPGRISNRIIDMRPGHSGDPFFEAQRRLNENENQRRFDARIDQGNRRLSKMDLETLFTIEAGMEAGMNNDMQGPLFHRQSLAKVRNPFAEIDTYILGDNGQLQPIGRPWLNEGAMTVPRAKPDWTAGGGRTQPFTSQHETNIRKIREPLATQKSLTGKKKGRLKQRP